jgi:hypothetical protein
MNENNDSEMSGAEFREENGWLIDALDNRAKITYWGTREAAEASLRSLKNCDNCVNCSRCSRCSGCSDCSRLYLKTGAIAVEIGAMNNGPPPVPTIPDIHARIYAAASAPGALDMGDWHKCENTHCRGGWAVTLAGEAGMKLEEFYDTPLAAMMIYDASDLAFKINPARFFDGNDAALADMKRMADAAAA